MTLLKSKSIELTGLPGNLIKRNVIFKSIDYISHFISRTFKTPSDLIDSNSIKPALRPFVIRYSAVFPKHY